MIWQSTWTLEFATAVFIMVIIFILMNNEIKVKKR